MYNLCKKKFKMLVHVVKCLLQMQSLGLTLNVHDYYFAFKIGYTQKVSAFWIKNSLKYYKKKLGFLEGVNDLEFETFLFKISNPFYMRILVSNLSDFQLHVLMRVILHKSDFKTSALLLECKELFVLTLQENLLNMFKRNKKSKIQKILKKTSRPRTQENAKSTFHLFGPNESKLNIIDSPKQKIGFLNVTDIKFAQRVRNHFKCSTIYFFYNGSFSSDYMNKIDLVAKFCDLIVFKKLPDDVEDYSFLRNKVILVELVDYECLFVNFHGVHFLPLCVMFIMDNVSCELEVSGFDFFLTNMYRSDYIKYLKSKNEIRMSLLLHNPFIQYDFLRLLYELDVIRFDHNVEKIIQSRRRYAAMLDVIYPKESMNESQ